VACHSRERKNLAMTPRESCQKITASVILSTLSLSSLKFNNMETGFRNHQKGLSVGATGWFLLASSPKRSLEASVEVLLWPFQSYCGVENRRQKEEITQHPSSSLPNRPF
jgi:hypothetical protein